MGEFFCLPSNGYVSLLDSEAKSATTLLIDKKTEAVDTISSSYGLQNIHEVQVSDDNQSFSTKDGVLYTKCKDELIWYPPKKKDEYFDMLDKVRAEKEALGAIIEKGKGGMVLANDKIFIGVTVIIEGNVFRVMENSRYMRYKNEGGRITGSVIVVT